MKTLNLETGYRFSGFNPILDVDGRLRLALIDLECAVIRLPVDQSITVALYRCRVRQLIKEFKNTHAPVDVDDWTEPAETKPRLSAMSARVIFLSLGVVLLWSQLGFVAALGVLCFSLAGMVRDDG